ncbi:MAG: hypothetical protein N2234_05230, partial [Planctomycetota bacterium]|nr:hypothetical protein [Planctomycetota bacterium]
IMQEQAAKIQELCASSPEGGRGRRGFSPEMGEKMRQIMEETRQKLLQVVSEEELNELLGGMRGFGMQPPSPRGGEGGEQPRRGR